MKPKTLYITDLDGTLLGPDGKMSATSVALLNHAIARGALVSVATARTPATVSSLLKDVNLQIPLVVMTGAALWDMKSGKYSDVQFFKPKQVDEIVKAYTAPEEGGGFLYTLAPGDNERDIMEIFHIGPINDVELSFMEERLGNPHKKFFVPPDGRSSLPSDISNAVLFFGMKNDSVALRIKENLERIKGINPMYYHDWHGDEIAEIEAFPAGASKAQAIQRLKKLTGADRVVVFGDNVNDLSMMGVADWSVAVANSIADVKRAADEIIGSNRADAVPRYILSDLRF